MRHLNVVNKDYKPGVNQTVREGDKNELSATAKTTGQGRIRPSGNVTRKIGNLVLWSDFSPGL